MLAGGGCVSVWGVGGRATIVFSAAPPQILCSTDREADGDVSVQMEQSPAKRKLKAGQSKL